MNRWAGLAHSLLRIVSGLLFIHPGAMKILGWFGGMPADQPPLVVGSQIWIGGMLELVGGALVLLGLFTRPVAFLLAGEMAVAYWQFHYGWGSGKGWTWPIENHGEPAVLLCFIFLLICAQGGGLLSLDGMLSKKKPA